MRQTNLSNMLRNSALAALAALAMVGTSNAAVYRTVWDPILDPDYSLTLGWTGSGEISLVNPTCLNQSAGTYSSSSCGSVALTSFSLAFYNPYSPPPALPGPLVATSGGPVVLPLPLSITTIKVDGLGGLTGIDLAVGSFYAGTFTLPYGSGTETESVDAYLDFVIDGVFAGPTLQLYSNNCEGDACILRATSVRSDSLNNLTWTLVPEPTSLALIGIAFAALGLTRRLKT